MREVTKLQSQINVVYGLYSLMKELSGKNVHRTISNNYFPF